MVIESVDVASYKIRMGTENIVGVHLPIFEPYVTSLQGMKTVFNIVYFMYNLICYGY